jgi:AcrR family transcriptional regulator
MQDRLPPSPDAQADLDPRVLRTRGLIEDAFRELLSEKSLQSMTVSDITTRATINRATFYSHFQDKFELFEYMIAKSFREMLRARFSTPCGFSIENLEILIETVRDFLSDHMRSCTPGQQQFHPSVFQQVQSQIETLARHWLEASIDEHETGTAAAMLSWAILGAGIKGNEQSQGHDLDVNVVSQFLTDGLTGLGYALD